jgi:hypothetical protein
MRAMGAWRWSRAPATVRAVRSAHSIELGVAQDVPEEPTPSVLDYREGIDQPPSLGCGPHTAPSRLTLTPIVTTRSLVEGSVYGGGRPFGPPAETLISNAARARWTAES